MASRKAPKGVGPLLSCSQGKTKRQVSRREGEMAFPTEKPRWFIQDVEYWKASDVFKDPQAINLLLASSRKEMTDNLSSFHTLVRYTVSVLFTVITAAGVLTSIALSQIESQQAFTLPIAFRIPVATLLLAVVPISVFSILASMQSYRLYVSSAIFMYETHFASGIHGHPWFEWFDFYFPKAPKTRKELIDMWMWDPTSQATQYHSILALIGLGCLGAGIGVFFV